MPRSFVPTRAPAVIAGAALAAGLLACRVDQDNLTRVQRAMPDAPAADVSAGFDGAGAPDAARIDQQLPADLRGDPPAPADRAPAADSTPAPDATPAPADVAPPPPPPPPPTPCQVSDWGDWSMCSRSCGGGRQSRTRSILMPPTNGGAPCPPLAETRPCNTNPMNACGGCGALAASPGAACGGCGTVVCDGSDRTSCRDPARTCRAVGASCGTPADGCGGQLDCGACADALTACGASFTCACGKPSALYSPAGELQKDRRAVSPDQQWYATAAGVFTGGGQLVVPLDGAKAFDWHPTTPGRFAVMHHFAPPDPLAVITVHQIGDFGRPAPVARATADQWFHAMAWQNDEKLALGAAAGGGCATVTTARPMP